MPEHVHMLIVESQTRPLAASLNVLKCETSRRLKHGRSRFWQARYFDFSVLSHDKRIEKLRYMHRDPVERGLVDKPESWPWSSFNRYLTGHMGLVEIESHWTWQRREREHSRPTRFDDKTVEPDGAPRP